MRAYVESTLREVEKRSGIPFAVRFAGGQSADFPSGQIRREPAFTLVFRKPLAYWRIAMFGHVGLLESYFDGDIDIEGNLAKCMAAGMQGGLDRPNRLLVLLNRWHEFLYNNADWSRAKRNAEFHYAQRSATSATTSRAR